MRDCKHSLFFHALKVVIFMAKKNIGAVLTLRDNMSATLKGIRKEQSEFRKDVENTRKTLERTYKRKHTMTLNNTAAMKKIKEVRKNLDPLRNKVVVALALKDMLTAKIRKTHNKLKALGKKTFAPIVRIKDKTGAFFSSVKDKIFNLKTLAGTVLAGVGVGKMLGSGAELEKQMISMEHFVGVQRQGEDPATIKKVAKDYVNELRKNAELTPFDTPEVIAAGTRALTVSKGDTKGAMNMLKIAEDMAALNPKASLEDAMEALAGLQVGDTQRMKKFGFRVTQDDIKKAGGIDNIINNQIQPFFAGGAAKLSKSAGGLWSTMQGMVSAKIQDLGYSVLEKLIPHMEGAVAWLEKSGPTIDRWAGHISTGIGFVIDKGALFLAKTREYLPIAREIIGDVTGWIADKFGWLGEKTSNLNIDWRESWNGIKNIMRTAWDFIEPILNLTAQSVKLLFNAFRLAFPGIKSVVQGTWKIVKPILETMGKLVGGVAKGVGKLADWTESRREKRQQRKAARGGVGNIDGSHYSGLGRVPFDGYIAELHKDEAVIPARNNPFIQNNITNTNKEERPIIININGVNKSTNEIINELVPQLKLALANM